MPEYSNNVASINSALIIFVLVWLSILFFIKRDRYYLLVLYTAVFFMRPGEVIEFFAVIRIELTIGIIMLISIFFSKKTTKNIFMFFKGNSIIKPFLIFFFIIVIGIPFAYWPGHALRNFFDFLKLCLFCTMIIATIDTNERLYHYLWVYILLSTWIAFIPFINLLLGQTEFAQGVERARGSVRFFSNPNVLACTIAQSLPFSIYFLVLEKKNYKKILLIILLLINSIVIVGSGSRGAFLAYISTFGVIFLFQAKKKVLGIFILCIIGVGIYLLMPEQYIDRQATIMDIENMDHSTKGRIEAWKDGFELFLRSPILGVGIGNFGPARGAIYKNWKWPHNLLIQLIAETGLLGLIAWSYLIKAVFQTIKMLRNSISFDLPINKKLFYIIKAITASIICQFVIGISQHNLYLFGFYFVISLLLVVNKIIKIEKKKIISCSNF